MEVLRIPLSEIIRWELNPKDDHDVPFLVSLIREYGFVVLPNLRQGKLYAGHGRLKALIQIQKDGSPAPHNIEVDAGGEWLIPFMPLDHLTEEQAQQFAVADNNAARKGRLNQEKLRTLFAEGLSKAKSGFSQKQLKLIQNPPAPKKKSLHQSSVFDVPDAIYPSEPTYGIPQLDPRMQADVVERPFIKWGSIARTSEHRGTIHFYTDDYKFMALIQNPLKVVDTKCIMAVEPNFSTYFGMPLYEVLWRIGQKRYMARTWQAYDVKVLVDLNVDPKYKHYNLLGVPKNWGAFCTRALAKQEQLIIDDYELVKAHTGQDPHLFVVYGGTKGASELCAERDWVWIPEYLQEVHSGT